MWNEGLLMKQDSECLINAPQNQGKNGKKAPIISKINETFVDKMRKFLRVSPQKTREYQDLHSLDELRQVIIPSTSMKSSGKQLSHLQAFQMPSSFTTSIRDFLFWWSLFFTSGRCCSWTSIAEEIRDGCDGRIWKNDWSGRFQSPNPNFTGFLHSEDTSC